MRVAVFVLNSFQFVNLMMKSEYKLSAEYKLKHRYNNYLIKLGLYVLGIKRLKPHLVIALPYLVKLSLLGEFSKELIT